MKETSLKSNLDPSRAAIQWCSYVRKAPHSLCKYFILKHLVLLSSDGKTERQTNTVRTFN